MRHGLACLHAAARRDRAHADARSTPTRPEILEHCQRIGKQFGLYDNALFHTEVTDLEWDDDRLAVDHPHQPRRRVHRPVPRPWAPGRCTCRSSPGIPGIEDVPGPLVPHQPLGLRLHRRRPLGRADGPAWPTSASPSSAPAPPSVQCVPHLARACQRALRLPAHAVVGRRARQPAHRSGLVRRDRHAGLAAALAGELHRQPDRRHGRRGPGHGRLDRSRPPHPDPRSWRCRPRSITPEKMMAAFEDSDFEKMEEIRARVDSDRRGPRHRREPQGLVPPAVQAAVLPRRVPAGLQRARHPPGRHRRQGRRAHHRDRRRGRRRRVRGRLHHLRLRLRGRHRVHAPRRLRPRPAATA